MSIGNRLEKLEAIIQAMRPADICPACGAGGPIRFARIFPDAAGVIEPPTRCETCGGKPIHFTLKIGTLFQGV